MVRTGRKHGEKRYAYWLLVGKPEGKRQLGRQRRKRVDNPQNYWVSGLCPLSEILNNV
jgi:hypothetical protein